MPFLVVMVAALVFLGAVVVWSLATVFALRFLHIDLPFSLAFPFYKRNQPSVLVALNGRSINTYVAISGLLLFAGPLFAGLTAYDAVRHSAEHSRYGWASSLGSGAWLVALGLAGVWISLRNWQKSTESGIGPAMLAVLVLKIAIDTAGWVAVISLLLPAAAFALFIYFGVRRIRQTSAGRRYPSRRDMAVARDFVAERFVPSESYKAQQRAISQTLIAAGLNHEAPAGAPLGRPTDPTPDENPTE